LLVQPGGRPGFGTTARPIFRRTRSAKSEAQAAAAAAPLATPATPTATTEQVGLVNVETLQVEKCHVYSPPLSFSTVPPDGTAQGKFHWLVVPGGTEPEQHTGRTGRQIH